MVLRRSRHRVAVPVGQSRGVVASDRGACRAFAGRLDTGAVVGVFALLMVLILVPIVELYVMVQVAGVIGVLPTVVLVVACASPAPGS